MKLNELISELSKLQSEYGDKEVWTQGCDCWGNVDSIKCDDEAVKIFRSFEKGLMRYIHSEELPDEF